MIQASLPTILIASIWFKAGCRASTTVPYEIFTIETLLLVWIFLAAVYGWVCRTRFARTCERDAPGPPQFKVVRSWIPMLPYRTMSVLRTKGLC
jgi:hypothetical protein